MNAEPSSYPTDPETRRVLVGDVAFGGGGPLSILAGPCVIEGRDHSLKHAEAIARICRKLEVGLVFKSSFDKANRTSGQSFRGPGADEGLAILAEVREAVGVPVVTDVHERAQCAAAGEVVDCLQIPAFLCRQTDLLHAAGRTGRTVNVKKGQFLAPEDMAHAIGKLREVDNDRCLVTERGASFGYKNLVVDFAGFPVMRALGQPLIFDATHSVQRPAGEGNRTGGDRTKVPFLARAAVACGVDGLFMEVHENPDRAPSDGPNMLPISWLEPLLESLLRVRDAR